ncbi:MAG: protein-S-isoprenylcysteine O-methyltransferase [Pseudomonadota bacterium]
MKRPTNYIPFLIMLATFIAATWRDAPYVGAGSFLLLMAVWYAIRLLIVGDQTPDVVEARAPLRERTLTTCVFIGMVVLPVVTLATPVFDMLAYPPLPGHVLIGLIFGGLGCFVFWRAHADLGNNWSAHLELQTTHALVTRGIYRHMRHPMYVAIFLITIAQAVLIENIIGGLSGFVTFTALYLLRINGEEAMMADKFGADWTQYASRTPRFGRMR